MKYLGNPQSGSLANKTASRNRYGQYLRTRATPVNPSTSHQVSIRGQLAQISSDWASLTQGQRDSWAAAAANEPKQDSLGQTIYPTGFGYYMSCNLKAAALGQPGVPVPPGAISFDGGELAFVNITFDPPEIEAISMQTDIEGGVLPSGAVAVVYASAPRSPGVQFAGNLKLLGAFDLDDDLGETTWNATQVAAAYNARWGTTAATGQRIRIRFDLYSGGRQVPFWAGWVPLAA